MLQIGWTCEGKQGECDWPIESAWCEHFYLSSFCFPNRTCSLTCLQYEMVLFIWLSLAVLPLWRFPAIVHRTRR